jgi:hypothetical protein
MVLGVIFYYFLHFTYKETEAQKAKKFAQGHRTDKQQSPDNLASEPNALIHTMLPPTNG